jgi:hypothetical protein
MTTRTHWGLTIVTAILVGLALVALYAGLLAASGRFNLLAPASGRFHTNGERIYFTATSNSGQPIVAEMRRMAMSNPMMACADCHGQNGRGGTVRMMMGSSPAPDVRYRTLTAEEHPPYNDELIKRAITQGLDSGGAPLDPFMPHWQMSDQDLDDLMAYLKTLD